MIQPNPDEQEEAVRRVLYDQYRDHEQRAIEAV